MAPKRKQQHAVEVYYDVQVTDSNKKRTYLCNSRDCEPVDCTFTRLQQHNCRSFETWKKVRTMYTDMVVIAEIKYTYDERTAGVAVTESCINTLDMRLLEEVTRWQNLTQDLELSLPNAKIHWWIYVFPFFVKTFRPVFTIFVDLYGLGKFIRMNSDCIRFTDNDEVRLLVWDYSSTTSSKPNISEYLSTIFSQLKRMMEKVIAGPFRSSSFDADEYNCPSDLKQLLRDLDSHWDFKLVKVDFVLDRPLFWTPDELVNFYLKYHHLTNDLHYVNEEKVFSTMEIKGYFQTDWPTWFRDEELGFVGPYMAPTPYQPHDIGRFGKNTVRHFRKYERQMVVSDSQIAQRMKSMCPKFEALVTGIRHAIMDIIVNADTTNEVERREKASLIWSQTQLISSRMAVETRPSVTDLMLEYNIKDERKQDLGTKGVQMEDLGVGVQLVRESYRGGSTIIQPAASPSYS